MHTRILELPAVPQSKKIDAEATEIARNVISLIAENEEAINDLMVNCEDEKVTISFAVSFDLGKNQMKTRLSFSVKHGSEIKQSIPNPDQGDLFNEENPYSVVKIGLPDGANLDVNTLQVEIGELVWVADGEGLLELAKWLLERLEGLTSPLLGENRRNAKKRQSEIDQFIVDNGEAAMLEVWRLVREQGHRNPIREEIAARCQEIDPTGTFH
jgi:hypothetical protein